MEKGFWSNLPLPHRIVWNILTYDRLIEDWAEKQPAFPPRPNPVRLAALTITDAPALSIYRCSFLIPFSLIPTFPQFGSSTSFLGMAFSGSTLRTMARGMIYETRSPTGFRSLLYHRLYIASSVYFLSGRTLASNGNDPGPHLCQHPFGPAPLLH